MCMCECVQFICVYVSNLYVCTCPCIYFLSITGQIYLFSRTCKGCPCKLEHHTSTMQKCWSGWQGHAVHFLMCFEWFHVNCCRAATVNQVIPWWLLGWKQQKPQVLAQVRKKTLRWTQGLTMQKIVGSIPVDKMHCIPSNVG